MDDRAGPAPEPGGALQLDALRDALALLRAVHAGDGDGTRAVVRNLAWPQYTALILAEMLAGAMDAGGDRIAVLEQWQREAGL